MLKMNRFTDLLMLDTNPLIPISMDIKAFQIVTPMDQ